jgi:hypothetical protein
VLWALATLRERYNDGFERMRSCHAFLRGVAAHYGHDSEYVGELLHMLPRTDTRALVNEALCHEAGVLGEGDAKQDVIEWTPSIERVCGLLLRVLAHLPQDAKTQGEARRRAFDESRWYAQPLLAAWMHRTWPVEYEAYIQAKPRKDPLGAVALELCSSSYLVTHLLNVHDDKSGVSGEDTWKSYLATLETALERRLTDVAAWMVAHAHIPLFIERKRTNTGGYNDIAALVKKFPWSVEHCSCAFDHIPVTYRLHRHSLLFAF